MINVMVTDVEVDIYDGPKCDQHRKYFNTYCEGDMASEEHSEDLIIKLADLPVGAKITVGYPSCPECTLPRMDKMKSHDGKWEIIGHEEKCECGFDWIKWIEKNYS